MKKSRSIDIIDKIVDGCSGNTETYYRYLIRTAWRVEADFDFLKKELPSIKSVLDIGGIPPLLTGLLKESKVERVMVFDPNAQVFKGYFDSVGISYINGDVFSSMDSVSSQFQLVCFCEVIEHLTGNILTILEEIKELVLPKEGYLYITTPNLRSISGALAIFLYGSGLASKPKETVQDQYSRSSAKYGYFGHVREYTSREIISLMESLGFVYIRSEFQTLPFENSPLQRIICLLETPFPSMRRSGKYLFRRKE